MKQAWVVNVDMGYGHQRAADCFRDVARERIITANTDDVIHPDERKQWHKFQEGYEGLSRISDVPLIGKQLWQLYDRFQRIADRYPFRDLSEPNIGTRYLDRLIERGLGKSIVDHCKGSDTPLLTTFFVPALAAGKAGMQNVFCVATDTDINRIWVSRNPSSSPVTYFAPTNDARRRLLQYGVPNDRVYLTGFPLPQENTSTR
jgi:hypothetical protein